MEDDSVIKDLIRSNLFMDGFPLHLSRKKDNWDSDTGVTKLDSEHWKHAYVTGLSDKVSADEIHQFLDAKVGGVKRVDCRVVNNLRWCFGQKSFLNHLSPLRAAALLSCRRGWGSWG